MNQVHRRTNVTNRLQSMFGCSSMNPGIHQPFLWEKSYHDGESERYDVDGHQGAEAGQDGQDQVVPGFRSVPSDLCDGTGLAGERGPR